MRCANCGQEVSTHSRFCPACGSPVVAEQTQRMERPAATQQMPAATQQMPTARQSAPRAAQAAQQWEAQQPYGEPRPQQRKSGAGRIVAAVVVVLALAGVGFGAWKLISNQHALEERLEQAEQRAEAAEQQAAEDAEPQEEPAEQQEAEATPEPEPEPPAADSSNASLVGTWTGPLIDTDHYYGNGYQCYGAQTYQPTLTIESIDELGKLHCSLTVLVHGHKDVDLMSDVDSHPDDQVVEYTGLVTTFNGDWFELELYIPGTQDKLEVEVELIDQSTVEPELTMVVEGNDTTDTYHLSRS